MVAILCLYAEINVSCVIICTIISNAEPVGIDECAQDNMENAQTKTSDLFFFVTDTMEVVRNILYNKVCMNKQNKHPNIPCHSL